MVATISFLAGENFTINALAGSGLGFFGSDGFGSSVGVGEHPSRTFITNGAGTTQGPEVDNVKWLNAMSGILGQAGSGIALTVIPNYQSTLAIDFINDTAVQTQNAKFYVYDRVNKNNDPSGVTAKVAEIIHPGETQANNGSGDTVWTTAYGSGSILNLCPSPGVSGLYAGNGNDGGWSDTHHRWHTAISLSPDSIGSKTQVGGYFSVEYY